MSTADYPRLDLIAVYALRFRLARLSSGERRSPNQTELAERHGVSRNALANRESGRGLDSFIENTEFLVATEGIGGTTASIGASLETMAAKAWLEKLTPQTLGECRALIDSGWLAAAIAPDTCDELLRLAKARHAPGYRVEALPK